MDKYGKKSLHVVFPPSDQDVAGIRTKVNAAGLKFYEPERYAGQHEVDFGQAKRLLKFFVDKGHDIGESSALALYAVIQMANFGGYGGKFVVIIADGIQKYRRSMETIEKKENRLQVNLQEAVSNIGSYNRVLWIHTMYTPRKEGIELIANSLGCDQSKISVPKAKDVERLLATQEIPKELEKALGGDGKSLLVCMMGNTSLMVAQVLAGKGLAAESLTGGISALSQEKGKQISELVRMATE
jgi:rhodanese-related sulfurtransferase